MAFPKSKIGKAKLQKLSPAGYFGFGQDRLRNVLRIGKNASTTKDFMSGYKNRAKDLY